MAIPTVPRISLEGLASGRNRVTRERDHYRPKPAARARTHFRSGSGSGRPGTDRRSASREPWPRRLQPIPPGLAGTPGVRPASRRHPPGLTSTLNSKATLPWIQLVKRKKPRQGSDAAKVGRKRLKSGVTGETSHEHDTQYGAPFRQWQEKFNGE